MEPVHCGFLTGTIVPTAMQSDYRSPGLHRFLSWISGNVQRREEEDIDSNG
jgi:hypothetical protein